MENCGGNGKHSVRFDESHEVVTRVIIDIRKTGKKAVSCLPHHFMELKSLSMILIPF